VERDPVLEDNPCRKLQRDPLTSLANPTGRAPVQEPDSSDWSLRGRKNRSLSVCVGVSPSVRPPGSARIWLALVPKFEAENN